ncbi:hypothetical protein AB0J72_35775 [Dactylosporangium sp. NPDC049742]|uniref:hypothetical protein n=1 Tax=Dactylosporangium sp. NPDC049742 TaxID=3154737 RepID=UPI00343878A3
MNTRVMVRDPELPISESIREELGDPVLIRRLASSPRSEVCLVEFAGVPAIVKRLTSAPDCAERYQTEVAALRLAGQVTPRPVAGLLATDPAAVKRRWPRLSAIPAARDSPLAQS